jgi:hypothetical protein
MKKIRGFLCLGAAVTLLASAFAFSQTPATTAAGPVPQALLNAKSIFVSNAGADSGLFPDPFTGDPDRPYTRFYAALKATGDYTLVSKPSQADLVLELRLTAPYGPSLPNKQSWEGDPLPMFRLVVYDRETHYILWTCTQSVEHAVMQKSHDPNFDVALIGLLNQFLSAAGKAPAPAH